MVTKLTIVDSRIMIIVAIGLTMRNPNLKINLAAPEAGLLTFALVNPIAVRRRVPF